MGPTSGILKIQKRRELRAGEDMNTHTGHYAVYSTLLVGVSALCCKQGQITAGVRCPSTDGITEPCVSADLQEAVAYAHPELSYEDQLPELSDAYSGDGALFCTEQRRNKFQPSQDGRQAPPHPGYARHAGHRSQAGADLTRTWLLLEAVSDISMCTV